MPTPSPTPALLGLAHVTSSTEVALEVPAEACYIIDTITGVWGVVEGDAFTLCTFRVEIDDVTIWKTVSTIAAGTGAANYTPFMKAVVPAGAILKYVFDPGTATSVDFDYAVFGRVLPAPYYVAPGL